jgi:hypothetical protein
MKKIQLVSVAKSLLFVFLASTTGCGVEQENSIPDVADEMVPVGSVDEELSDEALGLTGGNAVCKITFLRCQNKKVAAGVYTETANTVHANGFKPLWQRGAQGHSESCALRADQYKAFCSNTGSVSIITEYIYTDKAGKRQNITTRR